MALHRLTSITFGVPDVGATAGYYEEFGLTPVGDATVRRFATQDGGEQLKLAYAPQRRLVELGVGVDDQDDLDRVAVDLARLDVDFTQVRHRIGSNFFWYLKDPAGNFSEYYSDLDCIVDDQLWKPSVVDGARGIYNWGPPLPPSFVKPEDLAALMAGSHISR